MTTMRRRPSHDVLDHLLAVDLFSACTKRELRALAGLGTVSAVRDGAVLTEQGSAGLEFCLLVDGHARCLVDEIEVAVFGPGDYFGEVALLHSGPRNATVTADGPATVLVFDRREFTGLLNSSAAIRQKLQAAAATRARANASNRQS